MSVAVPALVSGVGNTLTAAGTVAEKAASALGSAGGVAAQGARNAPADIINQVQQTLIGTTTSGQVDQSALQDITRLLGIRITQGTWTPQQRDQLNSAVARVANIAPDDARRRVDEAQNTINDSLQKAEQALRQAAEATRTAVAVASYWAFAAIIIGAIAALLGARYGELDESNLPSFARVRFSRHPQARP
jgi:hypothetical protein